MARVKRRYADRPLLGRGFDDTWNPVTPHQSNYPTAEHRADQIRWDSVRPGTSLGAKRLAE